MATGLNRKPEEQQLNMLLYCMGQEAEELLTSMGTEPDNSVLRRGSPRLEEYFLPYGTVSTKIGVMSQLLKRCCT